MILLGKMALILCIMAMTEVWNAHLHRERKTKYYLGDQIEHKADSLLNSWAKEEMKMDSL